MDFVRKIDDLGRIVIPKEVRRIFKIRTNDMISMHVDDDKIVLKKYNYLSSFDKYIDIIIRSIDSIYDCCLLVTDREKIVCCSKKLENNYLNKYISASVVGIINSHYEIFSKDELQIIPGGKYYSNYYILPLIVDSNCIGSVILFSENNVLNLEKDLVKLIRNFLKKVVEE